MIPKSKTDFPTSNINQFLSSLESNDKIEKHFWAHFGHPFDPLTPRLYMATWHAPYHTISRALIYTVVSITVIKLEYENDYENRKRIRAQLRLLNKKKNDERGKIQFQNNLGPDEFTDRVSISLNMRSNWPWNHKYF